MNYTEKQFANVDLALRRGCHINRSSLNYYWVCDNYDDLKAFYANYGATLVHHPDGYFFLTLSSNSKIRSRLLPAACVHLGEFIALKSRDPEITQSSGWIQTSSLLRDIKMTVPENILRQTYAPGAKEGVADDRITQTFFSSLKTLADLCFIEIGGDRSNPVAVKPLEAINRFAELARYNNAPDEGIKIRLETERGIVFNRRGGDEENSEDEENVEEIEEIEENGNGENE